MRREKRNNKTKESNTSIWITGGVLVVAILTFVVSFVIYSNQLNEDIYSFDSEYLSQYTNNIENEELASASSGIGKTVNEVSNSVIGIKIDENTTKETSNKVKTEATQVNTTTKKESQSSNTQGKDPDFIKPIEGEILKEYAKDSLVYSETLKEWTTHLGIDIKAERATVVKASADGKVTDIKNDPRYGLTVIIKHSNGFETRYANLLTTEFVSEGEEVKAGQTIGTVGDSAIYEIVDESHLHFEILKDSEYLNPAQYIDF